MTMSFGVCTIVHGYGVVFVRGTPGGRQRASGSSLLRLSLCFLYSAWAAGSIGTSTPEPTRSTFSRIAFGCQLPDRSGWPSVVRGTGPAGGHAEVPPPAPRPWAAAAFEINSIAAPAAIKNVKLLAIRFIRNSPWLGSIPLLVFSQKGDKFPRKITRTTGGEVCEENSYCADRVSMCFCFQFRFCPGQCGSERNRF